MYRTLKHVTEAYRAMQVHNNNVPQPPGRSGTDEMVGVVARVLPIVIALTGCIIYIQQINSEVAVLKARQELNYTSTRETLTSLKEDMTELKDLLRQRDIKVK